MVIKRPSSKPKHKQKQNLCLDKAYHSKEIEQEIVKRGYILHIYDTEEKKEYFIKKTSSKKMGCRKNKFMAQ
jgi:hypothetical protein